MARKRRKRVSSEELERVVTLLPPSVVRELDWMAEQEELSRSAMVRTLVIRELREYHGQEPAPMPDYARSGQEAEAEA